MRLVRGIKNEGVWGASNPRNARGLPIFPIEMDIQEILAMAYIIIVNWTKKIEDIFARILIKYLSSSLEEVKNNEK